MSLTMTLAEVSAWYREQLRASDAGAHPRTLSFDRRLQVSPHAALAEAVVYHYLVTKNREPRFFENPSTGGVDFECSYGSDKFAVEVTSFGDSTVTERSGYPNELQEQAKYVDIPSFVRLVRSRLSNKAVQAGKYAGPRVLAIVSTHVLGTVLFSSAAQEFLTGEMSISFNVHEGGGISDVHSSTELKNSAFLRPSDEGIGTYRSRYAFVLFFAAHGNGAHVSGMMHPEPEHALAIDTFSNVPFARLEWPVRDNQLRVEWVIAGPRAEQHLFIPLP